MESELKRFLEERGYRVPDPNEIYGMSGELIAAAVIVSVVIVGLVLLGLFT